MLKINCWLNKRLISRCIDSGGSVPPRVVHHLKTCDACRNFHDLSVEVEERLTLEAQNKIQMPSVFLRRKTLLALRQTEARAPQSWLRPVWQTATAVFGIFFLAIGFLHHESILKQKLESRSFMTKPSVVEALNLLTTATELPSEKRIVEWSRQLNQPLETELNSVIHDARNAVDLLAHNFMPDKLSSF